MKRIFSTPALMIASVLALTACSDPLIGEWEAKDGPTCDGSEKHSEFEVDDDLKIDGKVWLVADGYCYECDIEGDFEEDGDSQFKADVELSGCPVTCNGTTDGEAECDMNDDEDEMDCKLTIGSCELDEETFEKKD